MRLIITINVIAAIVLLSTSCGPSSREVSNDKRFSHGYGVGNVWLLERPLVLVHKNVDYYRTGTSYFLDDPKNVPHASQSDTAVKSIATLAAGTRLRIQKLVATHVLESESPVPVLWKDLVAPIGEILDGEYSGTDVDLRWVSTQQFDESSHAWLSIPSSKYLKKPKG